LASLSADGIAPADTGNGLRSGLATGVKAFASINHRTVKPNFYRAWVV